MPVSWGFYAAFVVSLSTLTSFLWASLLPPLNLSRKWENVLNTIIQVVHEMRIKRCRIRDQKVLLITELQHLVSGTPAFPLLGSPLCLPLPRFPQRPAGVGLPAPESRMGAVYCQPDPQTTGTNIIDGKVRLWSKLRDLWLDINSSSKKRLTSFLQHRNSSSL